MKLISFEDMLPRLEAGSGAGGRKLGCGATTGIAGESGDECGDLGGA